MSRRDTIIVAVLINAGLLIVLFASALKSSSDAELAAAPASAIQEAPDLAFKKEPPPVIGDEVDQALNHFSQNTFAANTATQPPSQPLSAPAPVLPNFVDDLKMIAQPQSASGSSVHNPALQTLMAPLAPQ